MSRVLVAALIAASLAGCRERGDYHVYDDPMHGAWREGADQRLVFFHEAASNYLDDSGRGWGTQWRRDAGVLELGGGTHWEPVREDAGPNGSVVLTWLDGGATATLTPAPYLVIEDSADAQLVEACDAGPPGN